MKLVAEQIAYLRKRKKELESRKEAYQRYCKGRESCCIDELGNPRGVDFQEEMSNNKNRKELQEIEHALRHSEFVVERNFECIDIGTAFYVSFEGVEEKERTMVIDQKTYTPTVLFATTESDFGKAVLGHKDGDEVTYTVQSNGRKMKVRIEEIDRIKENYTRFIRETEYTKRISEVARRDLRRLKVEDKEEYKRRHYITPSQELLLLEELGKIGNCTDNIKEKARRGVIKKLLSDYEVLPFPKGDTIQIGSNVKIMLQDGKEMSFELVNRAVSTEIEGEYVERISPLGEAIYGLRVGEQFSVKRSHKPNLRGVITQVENVDQKERVK